MAQRLPDNNSVSLSTPVSASVRLSCHIGRQTETAAMTTSAAATGWAVPLRCPASGVRMRNGSKQTRRRQFDLTRARHGTWDLVELPMKLQAQSGAAGSTRKGMERG
jgi:hypothetical protein